MQIPGSTSNFASFLHSKRVARFTQEREERPPVDPIKRKLHFLTENKLEKALTPLKEWEPCKESLPSEYPSERQELRRDITFDSFKLAIEFMLEAAALFHREDHHPRWGNEWRTVTIRLSTWDIENKITRRDIELAKKVDDLLRDFRARKGKRFGKIDWPAVKVHSPAR
jgi:4a-hydroxytetrahydrobiopterin dehydratase